MLTAIVPYRSPGFRRVRDGAEDATKVQAGTRRDLGLHEWVFITRTMGRYVRQDTCNALTLPAPGAR